MQLTFHGEGNDICLVFANDKEVLEACGFDSSFKPRYVEVARADGAFYAAFFYDGCWSVSIRQIDEDVPIPSWLKLIKVETGANGYSADLVIEVPDDVVLRDCGDDGF